jgi:hypothetical protein
VDVDGRQAWEIYYDELRRRTEREPRFGREQAIAEAAHEAYRATADHLTRTGWSDDRALVVTHAFGETVKAWLAGSGRDWDGLREQLRARSTEWNAGES